MLRTLNIVEVFEEIAQSTCLLSTWPTREKNNLITKKLKSIYKTKLTLSKLIFTDNCSIYRQKSAIPLPHSQCQTLY